MVATGHHFRIRVADDAGRDGALTFREYMKSGWARRNAADPAELRETVGYVRNIYRYYVAYQLVTEEIAQANRATESLRKAVGE